MNKLVSMFFKASTFHVKGLTLPNLVIFLLEERNALSFHMLHYIYFYSEIILMGVKQVTETTTEKQFINLDLVSLYQTYHCIYHCYIGRLYIYLQDQQDLCSDILKKSGQHIIQHNYEIMHMKNCTESDKSDERTTME